MTVRAPKRLPLAFLLTWTTYGTWLHGDDRWSVDRRHNEFGTPQIPPCPRRRVEAQGRLRGLPVRLCPGAREATERAMRIHCELKGFSLHAMSARTNHVHVVVTGTLAPELIVQQFKQWATRELRAIGLMRAGARVWANGASTRYLWNHASVANAVEYVRNQ